MSLRKLFLITALDLLSSMLNTPLVYFVVTLFTYDTFVGFSMSLFYIMIIQLKNDDLNDKNKGFQ